MKYLVFLDIDGVFTSARIHTAHNSVGTVWSRFDPVAVDFMNYIHDTYVDVEFVFMSTWVKKFDGIMARHWAESALRNSGFRGKLAYYWKTNPDNLSYDYLPLYEERAYVVKDYLKDYGNPVDFILFDDDDHGFNKVLGVKRFVKTDPIDGLLHKHMLNAKSIMGNWEKK